jgi:hypothetical protein
MAPVRLKLGKPKNGWIEVHLSVGGKAIEFFGSDVPNNPLQELVDALVLSSRGLEASVWWHLEPDGYYFQFAPSGSDVELRVLFAPESKEGSQSEIVRVVASRESVLLPIWRALRSFQSQSPGEEDWPLVSAEGLESMREALR